MGNLVELNEKELREVEGGNSDPDGCSGCNAGTLFREWVISFLSAMGKQGHVGQPNGNM